ARRDVLELPVAKVVIECVGAARAREKNVDASVGIDIGQAHPRALRELAVFNQQRVADSIGEWDSGMRGRQQREPGAIPARARECAPAVAVGLMPRGICFGSAAAGRESNNDEKERPQRLTSPRTRAVVRSAAPRPASTIFLAALPALRRAAGS